VRAAATLEQVNALKLLQARLWVARLGERDMYGWWAAEGVLGPDGAFVGPRVLLVTHPRVLVRTANRRQALDLEEDLLELATFYNDPKGAVERAVGAR
jgi:hypothetical protein